MAKKKNIKATDIISKYMDYVLLNGKEPTSVYAFSKENNFEETLFYDHFTSFENLEQSIFETFSEQTISLLEQSDEYQHYSSKQKLLSFYYSFFEMLSANRSYVFLQLKDFKGKLKSFKKLKKMKTSYINYFNELNIETIDFKEEKVNKIKDMTLHESAWIQLLLTIEFWLNDDSKSFEKTDIYIEKSLRASFDLLEITPIRSVFDFAKFLYKQKVNA